MSSSDIIPGLESTNSIKETFPQPSKKKDIEKMKANKHPVKTMYIHNLEIQAVNGKLEKEIEHIIAKLHVEKMRKQGGATDDPREVKVRIQDRRVTARCHNGWKFVS